MISQHEAMNGSNYTRIFGLGMANHLEWHVIIGAEPIGVAVCATTNKLIYAPKSVSGKLPMDRY
ncbi:hypothetical protein GCM10009443_02950 [Mucilaginibacter ginsenosidivorans]